MSGVLVLPELLDGSPTPAGLELIGAGRAIAEHGAGPLTVALIGHDVDRHLDAVDAYGASELVAVCTPQEHFEAHVWQAALEALLEERRPAVVLAAHTVDSLGFLAAVAARGGHGFASDVIGLSWGEQGPIARRGAYGERLVAELDFPDAESVLLTLRAGAFAPADADSTQRSPSSTRPQAELREAARTERVELREPPSGDVDITKAELLLSIGRGVEDRERIAELEELAEKMGATLSASRPLVDAGWIPSARQVGQSGRTVAPKVYIALGISGAVQHVAGMAKARTIIAVNSDPQAPIFGVAHYGAVADLFEVAAELERQFT